MQVSHRVNWTLHGSPRTGVHLGHAVWRTVKSWSQTVKWWSQTVKSWSQTVKSWSQRPTHFTCLLVQRYRSLYYVIRYRYTPLYVYYEFVIFVIPYERNTTKLQHNPREERSSSIANLQQASHLKHNKMRFALMMLTSFTWGFPGGFSLQPLDELLD